MIPNCAAVNTGCGVCHSGPAPADEPGDQPRNPYGQAVETLVTPGGAESCWGEALAALDSDGDGFTNGQEPGDPNGTWSLGDSDPGDPSAVSHPGDATSAPTLPLVVLVSNLDQAKSGFGSLEDYDQAQAFTTGANGGGYTLASVEIALFVATDTAFPGTVSIWNKSFGRRPDSSMGTLTNPASLSPVETCKVLPCPEAAYEFTSSSGIVLDASTTCFAVIDAGSSGDSLVNIVNTGSSREDPGANRIEDFSPLDPLTELTVPGQGEQEPLAGSCR